MSEFAKEFGRRVKRFRELKKLTQKELAEDAGLSVSYLSEVENGKRSVSLIKAVNLAYVLDVPLVCLTGK